MDDGNTYQVFWYRVPMADGSLSDWSESRYYAETPARATEVQQRHWDYLKSLGYYLSARP